MSNDKAKTGETERDCELSNELTDKQLDEVSAGDIKITKHVDSASPNLFAACCSGTHIQTAH